MEEITRLYFTNINEFFKIIQQENFDFQSTDNNGRNLITWLIFQKKFNSAERVIELVGEKCCPTQIDNKGYNCLIYASVYKNVELVSVLLKLKIVVDNINYLYRNSSTVLAYVLDIKSQYYDINVIKLLLLNGAKCIEKNTEINVLYFSVFVNSDDELTQFLLENNIDTDKEERKEISQYTTLIKVAFQKKMSQKTINLLIERENECFKNEPKIYDVGEFENIKEIGNEKGSYGQVQLVVNKETQKVVILKKYIKFTDLQYIRTDIYKEIFFLRKINSEYFCSAAVQLYGIIKNQKLYLVLQALDQTLSDYCEIIKTLDNRNFLFKRLLNQLMQGLYDIHCLGIFHSDIKPVNVMVNKNKIFYIDFGISEYINFCPHRESIYSYITTPNVCPFDNKKGIMLSLGDNAVEIFRSNQIGRVSYSSDIFSLGVTLIQCILGKRYNYHFIDGDLYYVADYEKPYHLSLVSEEDINNIKSYGEDVYPIILSMIEFDSRKRILLANELGIPLKVYSDKTVSYKFNFINDLQLAIVSNYIHYLKDEIIQNQYEVPYIDQIVKHNEYVNIHPLQEDTFNAFQEIINKFGHIILKKYPFDVTMNSFQMMRDLLHLLSFEQYAIYYLCIIEFLSKTLGFYAHESDEYLNTYLIPVLESINIPFYKSMFIEMSQDFFEQHVLKYKNKRYMTYIQYIVFQLQTLGTSNILISNIEWFLIKKSYDIIPKLNTEIYFNIYNMYQALLLTYINKNNINIDFPFSDLENVRILESLIKN